MATDLMAVAQVEKKRAPQKVLPRTQVGRDARIPCSTHPTIPITTARRNTLFSETLLEMSSTRPQRRTADLFMSILLHTVILTALLLPPLYFTDTIDLKQFSQTFLVAPPPPPPPPPAPAAGVVKAHEPRRVFVRAGKLIAPTYIPSQVAQIKEGPLESDAFDGVPGGVLGGVLGGVSGGQLGGVIGGIVSGTSRTYIPLPTPTTSQPRAPIRVGGRVKPPRALVQTVPIYPVLAKQTRLEGTVSIDALIDTEGNVVEMRVVSGNPLLIPAALTSGTAVEV
jgi:periplasmic protein TonB